MLKLALEFMRLFLMRQKPQDIPYSKVLVVILVAGFFCINVPLNLVFANLLLTQAAATTTKAPLQLLPLYPVQSIAIVSSYVLIMWVSLYSGLAFYSLQNRFVQTISSVLGVEILLSIWLGTLLVLPMSAMTGILFIVLLYWQFMLHIYIFSNSLSCSLLKAGMFALLYILLQHNMNEAMFNLFMRAQ